MQLQKTFPPPPARTGLNPSPPSSAAPTRGESREGSKRGPGLLCLALPLCCWKRPRLGLRGGEVGEVQTQPPGAPCILQNKKNKIKKELWTPGLEHLRVCSHCLLASLHDRVQDASRGAGQLPATPPKIWGAFQAQLDTTAPPALATGTSHRALSPSSSHSRDEGGREAPWLPSPCKEPGDLTQKHPKSQEHAKRGD